MDGSLLVEGGNVWTGNPEYPLADAFLVENGIFTAVGDHSSVRAAALGKRPERIDAGDALVIPGITDSHIHLTAYCKGGLYTDLSNVRSIDELMDELRRAVANYPGRRFLRATGYNETLWDEPVSPTAQLLDKLDVCVLVSRYCGHVHVANRKALETCGLWDSHDPNILRGPDGGPTGVLNEGAAGPLLELVAAEQETRNSIRALASNALKRLSAMGITAAHACDVPLYGLPEDLSLFFDLMEAGELPLRVISYHDVLPNLSLRSGLGNRFLAYGGLKLFLDGNLGGHTAALRSDYSDRPGCRGQLTYDDDELYNLLCAATLRDIQVQMHMIGDAATDQAIRVAKRLAAERITPRFPLRFNHVIVLAPDQEADLKKLGVVVDVQPIQAYTDRTMAPRRLGRERLAHSYSFRRLFDTGLLLTGSSDGPMENPNPWLGIWTAVCRSEEDGSPLREANPNEKLTLDEALTLYTCNPYKAICWGNRFGRIEKGAWADFAILENNPAADESESLKSVRSEATYLEGVRTH